MADESKSASGTECWETPAWAALKAEVKAVDALHLRELMEVRVCACRAVQCRGVTCTRVGTGHGHSCTTVLGSATGPCD